MIVFRKYYSKINFMIFWRKTHGIIILEAILSKQQFYVSFTQSLPCVHLILNCYTHKTINNGLQMNTPKSASVFILDR